MNISKRTFSYPVLNENIDGYQKGSFKVVVTNTNDLNDLILKFNIELDSIYLKELISKGIAKYFFHIECSATSFRRAYETFDSKYECKIRLNNLSGKVEVVAMVVSCQDIENYTSNEFDEDYKSVNIFVPKHSILAYENLPIFMVKPPQEEYDGGTSIFNVCKITSDDEKNMEVDYRTDKILIHLSSKSYDLFVNFIKSKDCQKIVHTMVIFPALVYIFEELKMEGVIEDCESLNWFISLNKTYKKRNLDLKQEIESEKTAIELAQDIMNMPIMTGLETLNDLTMSNDGDEE